MSYWIRLGGRLPATEIAPHSPPTWETWADGGNGPASFEMGQSAKFQHNLLTPDALCEIFLGVKRVWFGRIEDYDRNDGSVTCRGIFTDTLGIPALDGGAATRSVAAAVVTAVGAPWNWQVVDPLGNATAMGSATGDADSVLMMHELFQQIAEQTGKRVGQDASGALFFRSTPTEPRWVMAPESAAFGMTSEGMASHLVGRYVAVGGANDTVTRSVSAKVARAELVDLTPRGEMTEAQAAAILDAALASQRSRRSWVNGVELPLSRLTTIGGGFAHGAAVRAGDMARTHGLSVVGGLGSSLALDEVIGKTRYTAGAKSIYLEPINTAPRTFADVIAAS